MDMCHGVHRARNLLASQRLSFIFLEGSGVEQLREKSVFRLITELNSLQMT